MARNQVPFWYATFVKKEPILKDGFDTGQYRDVYSDPVRAKARISSATGESESELFRASVRYDRVISSVTKFPIDEYSRLWIDVEPTEEPDYVVKRVALGLNQHLWAIAKVIRNADEAD